MMPQGQQVSVANSPSSTPSAIPQAPTSYVPQPGLSFGTGQPSSAGPGSAPAPNVPWYERILPTAGAVLGGLGGALAGGAVDVGTLGLAAPLINPFTAGIAGASAGDVLGRAGENLASGQNVKNDLGSSAIQGGVGQLLGNGLGFGLTKLLGGAVSPIADTVASKFVQGQEAPGMLTGTLSKDLMNNYGVTNVAKSVPKIADTITGSADNEEGALANKAVMQTLQDSPAPHVDITDIGGNFDKNMAPINAAGKSVTQQILDQTHGLSVGDQKAILTNVDLELNKLPSTVGGQTDNVSAFNLSKSFANKAGDLADQAATAKGSAATSLQATSDVYDQLAKELQDRTLSPGGQDITLSPAGTQALKDGIVKQLGTSEPKAATQISNDIDAASNPDGSISARSLRTIQAKWVVANKGLSASQQMADRYGGMTTADLAKSGLPIAGAIAGGGKGLVAGAAGAITKSPQLDASVAGGLSKLAGVTSKNSPLVSKIVPLLSRITGATAGNLPNDASALPNSVQSNSAIPAGVPQQGANAVNPTTGQPVTTDPLQQLYSEIIAQSQTPTGISGNLVSTANTLAPQVQKQQMAAPVIANLLSAYNNAGGPQGMGGGLLSRLSGLIPGTAANTYNSQEGAAAAQLASILGITPQQAMSMIPQLMQTQGAAAPQVGGIQSVLQSLNSSNIPAVPSAIPAQ
jgi:hypothetical protein